MERPLWSGSLAFGIVTIPVRLLAATRDHDLHFHQISRTDRKRIRYRKVAEGGTDEVPASDIVKGYEVKPGHYVVFDDDELTKLAARKSRVIDISSFVDLTEIDPLYFDRPYLLVPDEQGEKPYRLLTQTLQRTGRTGVAQMVMHGKEHIVALRSIADRLYLHTLRFADEVVRPAAVAAGSKLTERELSMAERLIESMHEKFDPKTFVDDYRKRLQAAIARKAQGKTLAIEEEPDEPLSGNAGNLLEALEKSLAGAHGRRATGAPPAKVARTTRRSTAAPVRKRTRART